jgi:hypothetical protein
MKKLLVLIMISGSLFSCVHKKSEILSGEPKHKNEMYRAMIITNSNDTLYSDIIVPIQ